MRTILSILALAFVVTSASAQTAIKEKKSRKAVKTEAVSATSEEAAPKAACCAKSTAAKAACHGKAEASASEAVPVDHAATTAATEPAISAEGPAKAAMPACCAAKAQAGKSCCADKAKAGSGGCQGKAEAHAHDDMKSEEAPAPTPNQ